MFISPASVFGRALLVLVITVFTLKSAFGIVDACKRIVDACERNIVHGLKRNVDDRIWRRPGAMLMLDSALSMLAGLEVNFLCLQAQC